VAAAVESGFELVEWECTKARDIAGTRESTEASLAMPHRPGDFLARPMEGGGHILGIAPHRGVAL